MAIHNYVTGNGTVLDPATLHQRFVAIRRANGDAQAADVGLLAAFSEDDARRILGSSQVPRKHTAAKSREAEASARYRGEGTTGNSCTMSGTATLGRQLHRVILHYRAEIANLPNGQTTRLMELDIDADEGIWVRDGQAGAAARLVRWVSLEVVIAKDPRGNLVLVHAQPNARPAKK
ncbi:hypothetical protein [Nakamurella lactea]|uniref:hypothetical protein n=1 Tax=Nakamurella lactea TaxID=459515 RepID=UPI00041342D3|nr:hypothetical protein [Nakamurella lactea]